MPDTQIQINEKDKNANNFTNLPQVDFHYICKLYSSYQNFYLKNQEVSITLKNNVKRKYSGNCSQIGFSFIWIKDKQVIFGEKSLQQAVLNVISQLII